VSNDGSDTRVFWIDWEHTVVHIGQDHRASNVLKLLDPCEVSLFKHVAFENGQLGLLFIGVSHVAGLCPQVRTVIIHDRRKCWVDFTLPFLPQLTPSAKTALLYRARSVTDFACPEINDGGEGHEGLRSWAKGMFNEHGWTKFPKIHFLEVSEEEY
jgi:hypothetical protein